MPHRTCLFTLMMLTLFACTALPSSAHAEDGDAGGQYKIGVVNMKEIFDAYDRQKDEYKELEKERGARQSKLDKIEEEIEANKKHYEDQKDSMSDEEKETLEEETIAMASNWQAQFKVLQEEIDRKEKKLLDTLFRDIRQSISEVGYEGNYHLVLEGDNPRKSAVLYFSSTLNITQKVIEALNTKYKDN